MKKQKNKKIHCRFIDHLTYDISLTNGRYTHCCKMPMMKLEENESYVNNRTTSRIVQEFSQGIRSKECATCWNAEDAGLHSYRQRNLTIHPQLQEYLEKVSYVQFQLPSYCQGTCYYCTPSLSTSIAKFGTWVNSDLSDVKTVNISNIHNVVPVEKQLEILDELPPKRTVNIGLVGGEPLIKDNVSHWLPKLLTHARSNGRKVELTVCTNAWTQFSVVEEFYRLTNSLSVPVKIVVSVENTHRRAEWVRGCNWQHLDRMVQYHRKNCVWMTLGTTENFLSVSNLPGLIRWYYARQFDAWRAGVVNQPSIQTHVLPLSYKKYIKRAKRIPGIKREELFMLKRINNTIGVRQEQYGAAISAAERVDSIRGTDVHAAFPELRHHLRA